MKENTLWVIIVVLALIVGLCVGYIIGKENSGSAPLEQEDSVVGSYKTDTWNGKNASMVIKADGTCKYPTGSTGTWVQEGNIILITLNGDDSAHKAEVVPGGLLLHGHFFERVS